MNATPITPETEDLKRRLQATWNEGDYDTFPAIWKRTRKASTGG